MMRNVLCQSVFQLAITLWMVYNGAEVFGIDRDYVCSNGFGCAKDNSQDELNYADKSVNEYLNTFIFNTFVIMQVCTGTKFFVCPDTGSRVDTECSCYR